MLSVCKTDSTGVPIKFSLSIGGCNTVMSFNHVASIRLKDLSEQSEEYAVTTVENALRNMISSWRQGVLSHREASEHR